MKIAIIRPSNLKHRVRGTGFYFENLKRSLLKNFPNSYYFVDSLRNLPDVSIVHYPFFEPFFLTLPIFLNKKIVVTVHDLTPLVFPKYFPAGLRGRIKWQIQKIALKNADAIITDSQNSMTDILKSVGIREDKVYVIYLSAGEEFRKLKIAQKGPDLELKIKKRYGLPDRFALYVGDVTWNKNLPRIVEAIKKANIPLVLVGKALIESEYDRSNPWNQDLEIVQKAIENDKLFTRAGFVNDEDLPILYNLATVFVMPSLYEGFGLPILEAMSCGCPVVTSREGSIPEVAGDAAFYVDPYSTDSIAGGIKKVFNDKNLQSELSTKGLKRAKLFSWKKTAQETLKVYEALVQES